MNPVRNSKKQYLLSFKNFQFNNGKLKISNGVKAKIIFGILIIFIFLGFWIFLVEPNNIKIENIKIEIKRLPPSFQGARIIHFSDIHSKNFGERENEILEILKKLNPDFIFITGDFVDWRTQDLESCQEFWKKFFRNYPGKIFGVLGNHDHRHPKWKILKNLLEESGIEILENETKQIKRNGDFIYLIGVDDPHEGYDDIEKAMAEIKIEAPKILLAHSPEIFRKAKGKDIDLILVGHTHGGQINIPFITDLFIPLKYDKQYKSGLFRDYNLPKAGSHSPDGERAPNPTYLYVNRGIGTTFLPIRFNASPEITLIELQ